MCEYADAKVVFNQITSAYQVLADDARRKQFDEECSKKEQEKVNRQAYRPPKTHRPANAYER